MGIARLPKRHYRWLSLLLAVAAPFAAAASPPDPVIEVWYGPAQSFGQLGQPQPWVNVVGNLSNFGGGTTLEYTLNGGGPVELTIGPDGNRLVGEGDFNIDLATADLLPGANVVEITADSGGSHVTTSVVTVNYQAGPVWPSNYAVDWATLSSDHEIQDVAHVVDGKWTLENGNVRTVEAGYDRLIAIGDVAWDDYEVVVPVTIHETLSSWLGVGILFRWNGHTDNPIVCDQPKCGWLPLGSICWYREGRLEIYGNRQEIVGTSPRTLLEGVTYWFKARVETNASGGLYSFKVWEQGTSEPATWDVTGQEELTDPQQGSMMLLTHRADVSFGPVTVTDLDAPADFPPVAADDDAFVMVGGNVEIPILANDHDPDGVLDPASVIVVSVPTSGGWSVDPATGAVTYVHTGVVPGTDLITYTVEDDDGLVSNEATVTITIAPEAPPAFASDDFAGCTLEPFWTFVNPLGDGTFSLATDGGDAVLELSLPAGTPHDAWASGGFNETARVMQPSADVDFEIEVKFQAEPTDGYNNQGVLVEEDADNWLRFDIYHNGSNLKAFMGSIISGQGSTIHLNGSIAVGTASFIRVTRIGDQWTMTHSGDGSTWISAGSFTEPLTARDVGVYAGNPIDALAFTSKVDYFFNTLAPISPEDSGSPPATPSDLSATSIGETAVLLDWTDNSTDEDGFTIERNDGSGFQMIAEVGPDVTSYTDSGLDCGTGYDYRVSAFGCATASGYSDPASVTTDACPGALIVHIADIDVSLRERGPWTSARGRVTVVDELGNPVEGATIHADWSGTTGPSDASSVTGADGEAPFTSHKVRNITDYCWTLTVTDVVGAGTTYDAAANVETSDSMGTDCPPLVRTVDGPMWVRAQPNPFKPSTAISFFLPESERVVLDVFDLSGRLVRELARGHRSAGTHRVTWDGRDGSGQRVASGVYFYRLETPREARVGKLIRR